MIGLTSSLIRGWEEQSKSGIGHATAKAPMGKRNYPLAFSRS